MLYFTFCRGANVTGMSCLGVSAQTLCLQQKWYFKGIYLGTIRSFDKNEKLGMYATTAPSSPHNWIASGQDTMGHAHGPFRDSRFSWAAASPDTLPLGTSDADT